MKRGLLILVALFWLALGATLVFGATTSVDTAGKFDLYRSTITNRIATGFSDAASCRSAALADAELRKASARYWCRSQNQHDVTFTADAPTTPASLTFTGLPTSEAVVTIGWTLQGTGKVTCRLDSYTAIDCPNPFKLGATTPLKAGAHSVEFWIDGTLAKRHEWTVPASAPTPTPPASSPPPTPTPDPAPPPAGALPAAPLPTSTAISGYSGQWNGTAISTSGASMERVADPNGSGRTVILARVKQGGASIYGGVRSEQLWNNHNSTDLVPGRDIWMSFAVMRKADETFPVGSGKYDDHLVFQTHTPQSGDTQPDIALKVSGQTAAGQMQWRVAYNTSGNVASNGWMSTEGNPIVHTEPLMPPGVWYRYVVHYRPGYASTHNPLLRVWRAKPGGAYEQIVTYTSWNTYNTSKTGAGPSYPRIGLYKWSSSTWTTNSVAWYLTPLYFGTGADLLEAGKAALAGL